MNVSLESKINLIFNLDLVHISNITIVWSYNVQITLVLLKIKVRLSLPRKQCLNH